MKSQEQKAIKLGEKRTLEKADTLPKGKETKKKKKAGDLTQDKKTREVETSTAKKNTVKSQEQKAIKLGKVYARKG